MPATMEQAELQRQQLKKQVAFIESQVPRARINASECRDLANAAVNATRKALAASADDLTRDDVREAVSSLLVSLQKVGDFVSQSSSPTGVRASSHACLCFGRRLHPAFVNLQADMVMASGALDDMLGN